LFINLWTYKELGIILAALAVNIILFILIRFFIGFAVVIIYGFFTARIVAGYSILKMCILYIRFLFTDKLSFKWR
ncbi:MAG: hypothetical protein IJ725_01260, partial [Ruminococcus sp.]|nr:hypothetical protein [Ruminococcus sp.]